MDDDDASSGKGKARDNRVGDEPPPPPPDDDGDDTAAIAAVVAAAPDEQAPPSPSPFAAEREVAAEQLRSMTANMAKSEAGRIFGTAVDTFNRNFVDLWDYLAAWAEHCQGLQTALPAPERAALVAHIEEARMQAGALVSTPATRGVPIGSYIEATKALPPDLKAQWALWLAHYEPQLLQAVAPRFAYPGLAVINECWQLKNAKNGKDLLRQRSKARVMQYVAALNQCAEVCAAVQQDHLHGQSEHLAALMEDAIQEAERNMPTTPEQAMALVKTQLSTPEGKPFVHMALRTIIQMGLDPHDLPDELDVNTMLREAGIDDTVQEDSLNGDIRKRRAELRAMEAAYALKHGLGLVSATEPLPPWVQEPD